MAEQPKHRLTDAELDEAFAQAHGSLRLTAALSELKERRAGDLGPYDIVRIKETRDEMARFDFLPEIPELLTTLDRIIAAHGGPCG